MDFSQHTNDELIELVETKKHHRWSVAVLRAWLNEVDNRLAEIGGW